MEKGVITRVEARSRARSGPSPDALGGTFLVEIRGLGTSSQRLTPRASVANAGAKGVDVSASSTYRNAYGPIAQSVELRTFNP